MNPPIIVSGIPRSGTSLLMQMLHAGGISVLTDQVRMADDDNPKGYFEYEKVKNLMRDNQWVLGEGGKAIKVIYKLLPFLPDTTEYTLLFIERDSKEIIASQKKMLQRSGRPLPGLTDEQWVSMLQHELSESRKWCLAQKHIKTLRISYASLLADSYREASRIQTFLKQQLDLKKMADAADPSLYRSKQRD